MLNFSDFLYKYYFYIPVTRIKKTINETTDQKNPLMLIIKAGPVLNFIFVMHFSFRIRANSE